MGYFVRYDLCHELVRSAPFFFLSEFDKRKSFGEKAIFFSSVTSNIFHEKNLAFSLKHCTFFINGIANPFFIFQYRNRAGTMKKMKKEYYRTHKKVFPLLVVHKLYVNLPQFVMHGLQNGEYNHKTPRRCGEHQWFSSPSENHSDFGVCCMQHQGTLHLV